MRFVCHPTRQFNCQHSNNNNDFTLKRLKSRTEWYSVVEPQSSILVNQMQFSQLHQDWLLSFPCCVQKETLIAFYKSLAPRTNDWSSHMIIPPDPEFPVLQWSEYFSNCFPCCFFEELSPPFDSRACAATEILPFGLWTSQRPDKGEMKREVEFLVTSHLATWEIDDRIRVQF